MEAMRLLKSKRHLESRLVGRVGVERLGQHRMWKSVAHNGSNDDDATEVGGVIPCGVSSTVHRSVCTVNTVHRCSATVYVPSTGNGRMSVVAGPLHCRLVDGRRLRRPLNTSCQQMGRVPA